MDSSWPAEQRHEPKLSKANAGWANLRPAQKGQPSRNPRGRPKKDLDLAAMAQAHAEQAVATLARCLGDETASWSAKISAAAELLNRGFGRAPASIDVNHEASFAQQFEDFIRSGEQNKVRASTIEHIGDTERQFGSDAAPAMEQVQRP